MPNPIAPTPLDFLQLSTDAYTLNGLLSSGQQLSTFDGMTVIKQSAPDKLADGFAAIAVENADGQVIIINEGTVPGASTFDRGTLSADIQIAQGTAIDPALADAATFADELETLLGGSTPIFVTGHSLGGIEAEAEAKQLVIDNPSDAAGGATFGAAGLPGQGIAIGPEDAQGNSTLINYVDRGDMVGNFALDTTTQTPNPFGAAAYHYGAVQMVGPASNAAYLQAAQLDFVTGKLLGLFGGQTIGTVLDADFQFQAISEDALALKYHGLSNYAADLNTLVSPPQNIAGLPSESMAWVAEADAASFDTPAISDFQAETDVNGEIVTPYFVTSYDPAANQITIDQTGSINTAEGTVNAGGVTKLTIDSGTGLVASAVYTSEDGSVYNATLDETTGNIQTLKINKSDDTSENSVFTYNTDGSVHDVTTGYSGSNLDGTLQFTQTTDITADGQLTADISGTGYDATFDTATITLEKAHSATPPDANPGTIAATGNTTITIQGENTDFAKNIINVDGNSIAGKIDPSLFDQYGRSYALSGTTLTVTSADGADVLTLNDFENGDFGVDMPYKFTAIEGPGALFTQVVGINNNGVILGAYSTATSGHYFTDTSGTLAAVTLPGYPVGISNDGTIVSQALVFDESFAGELSYATKNGVTSVIVNPASPNFTEVTGISENGIIVGTNFVDNGGAFTTIAETGTIAGVNNDGVLVGSFGVDNAGTIIPVDVPGASSTHVTGINEDGTIVGNYTDATGQHGFVATGALENDLSFITIDMPGATDTFVSGINDSGTIVGDAIIDGVFVGFSATDQEAPLPTQSSNANNSNQNVPNNTNSGMYGNGNTITAGSNGNMSVYGNSNTVTDGAGSTVALHGNTNTVNAASNDIVTTDPGASNSVYASGNDVTVTTAGSNDYVEFDGNTGSAVVTGSGTTVVNLGTGSTISVRGTNNTADESGASGNSISLGGSGNTANIFAGGNDTINVTGTNNTAFDLGAGNSTISLNGNSDSGIVYGTGSDVQATGTNSTIELDGISDTAEVFGTGNSVNIFGSSATATVFSDNNTVFDLGAGNSTISLNGNSDSGIVYGAGSSVNADGANSYIELNGSQDTATINDSGDTVSITGTNSFVYDLGDGSNTISLAGSNNATEISGEGDTITATGTGDGVTVFGAGDITTLSGASERATLYGSGASDDTVDITGTNSIVYDQGAASNTISLAGSNNTADIWNDGDTITVTGTGDGVTVFGAGNTTTLSGASDAATIYGSGASGDTVDITGTNSIVYDQGAGNNTMSLAGSNNTAQIFGNGSTITVTGTGDGVTVFGAGNTTTLSGVSENATLYGSGASGDTVNITGTNSIVYDLSNGTNTIFGDASSTIYAGGGADTIVANGGTMEIGANGNPIAQSFGHNTIFNGGSGAPTGQIGFGAGVTIQNLWFTQVGNNLQIGLMGTNENVTVSGWFASAGAQVTKFFLADQTQLANAKVAALVSAMAAYATANPGFNPTSATQVPGNLTLQSALATAWASKVAITDTAANISAELDALQTMAANGQLSSILLTDTGTPTLAITATQLTGDATALGLITGPYNIAVSGVTAANATNVAGQSHVTSVSISDTAANVVTNIAALQALGTKLAAIALTDSGTPTLAFTGAQFTTDSTAIGAITGFYNLTVTGVTAANAATAGANTHVTSITISDIAANVVTNIAALQALGTRLVSVTLTDTGTPTLSLTATQFTADAGAIGKITGSYNLAISAVTAANATSVGAQAHVTSVSVSDTATNVVSNIAALQALGTKLLSIALTDTGTPTLSITATQLAADATALGKITGSYNLTVSAVLAANATSTAAQAHVVSVSVLDTAAHVTTSIAALQTLAAGSKLTAIAFTDTGTPALTFTAAQATSDVAALSLFTGSFTLTVSDTSANVVTNLAALQTLASLNKLTSITLTGTGTQTLAITATQFTNDATALSKITTAYNLTVSAVAAANAASVLANTHVTSITVSDTAANVVANIAALQTAGTKLASIALTDGGTPTLTFTATQFTADATAIGKIGGSYNLSITQVLAANASTTAAKAHVTSISVSDTAANVITNIAALQTLSSTKLSSILLTDAGTPTLVLTTTQLTSDAGALGKITTAYHESVTADANTTETLTATAAATVNTISFNSETQGVTANLSSGTATTVRTGTTFTYTLHNFQNATGSTFADTLTAGASGGVLTGNGGADTYVLNAAGIDVAKDTAAHLSGTTVQNFSVLDGIDLTNVTFGAQTTLGFVENGGNTAGTLTVSDGTHNASLMLLGQYTAASFQKVSDGGTGTLVALASTPNLTAILAAAHG